MPQDSKNTSAGGDLKLLAVPFFGAIALTAIFLTIVYFVVPKDSYFYAFLLERSWIQHATFTVFWFTVLQLIMRSRLYFREKDAVQKVEGVVEDALKTDLGNTLVWNDSERLESFIDEKLSDRERESLITRRIFNGLSRLRKTQSTSEIDDYFKTRSEVDFSDLDAGYGTLQYLIWLIPTLGFIGTVMGIGSGIAGFAGIIEHAEDFSQIKTALPSVTTALGTAFDTTFLALLLSVIVVCYSAVLRKAQELLLNRTDTLCLDGILSMFREHSQDTELLVESINECVKELRKTMNGNRGAIETLVSALSGTMQELLAATRKSNVGQELFPVLQGMSKSLIALGRVNVAVRDELRKGREETSQLLTDIAQLLKETNESLRQSPNDGRVNEADDSPDNVGPLDDDPSKGGGNEDFPKGLNKPDGGWAGNTLPPDGDSSPQGPDDDSYDSFKRS
ncbi:MotA/TolQ/ExbB proton channel family protein [Candidatus Hydrogenedentota bacterium]